MKTIFRILLFTVGVTTVALAQTSPVAPTTDAAREVEEASRLYFAALDRGDAAAVEAMLCEDFLSIAPPRNTPVTKAQQIGTIQQAKQSGRLRPIERQWGAGRVRFYGETAVLTGWFTTKEPRSGGKTEEVFHGVTHVWVKQDGRWRLAHAQRFTRTASNDSAYWSERYREGGGFNLKPNRLLAEAVKDVRPGQALDVGMGQGRNALYLAQQGWDVTGIDLAEEGIRQAREQAQAQGLKLNALLQSWDDYDFGVDRWDLIALIYIGVRDFADKAVKALKPGGLLVIEAFHKDATLQGRSIGAGVTFDTDELKKLFPSLRVLRYEEPEDITDFGLQKVRLVRMIARKEK
jgi:2-polyprenyl-3-methyl-5-hydroxy-6-metoxy-1,4-benzoquinol methylase